MKKIFNPFTKKPQYIQEESKADIGGKYGINVETLTGDKTLVPGVDPIYQYLDPNDVNRIITLDTTNAKAGDRFIAVHNGNWDDINYLQIMQGAIELDRIYVSIFKTWIFDGTNWTHAWIGTGTTSSTQDGYRGIGIGKKTQAKECGIAIGNSANGVKDGVSVGFLSDAHDYGTAIGYDAAAITAGVAVGHTAVASPRGTAIGYGANTKAFNRAIALGYFSKNQRATEIAMNIGDPVNNDRIKAYNQIVVGSWIRETTNNTPTIMWIDGEAVNRFTIRAQSALTFKIMVTARDNTTGDCAAYLFDGLIKRDGANNTTLCVCNKTVLHEDDATWDCDVATDDTNEALQITVTGDADNNVKWAARLDGVETSWTALN